MVPLENCIVVFSIFFVSRGKLPAGQSFDASPELCTAEYLFKIGSFNSYF